MLDELEKYNVPFRKIIPTAPEVVRVRSKVTLLVIDSLYYWYARKNNLRYDDIKRSGYKVGLELQYQYGDNLDTRREVRNLDVLHGSKYYMPVFGNNQLSSYDTLDGDAKSDEYAWNFSSLVQDKKDEQMALLNTNPIGFMALITAQAYVYGDKFYINAVDSKGILSYATILAANYKYLGTKLDIMVESELANDMEYNILLQYTKLCCDLSKGVLVNTREESKKLLEKNNFEVGGLYLLLKRRSGRGLSRTQDSSIRYDSRSPDTDERFLVILDKYDSNTLNFRVLPQVLPYASTVSSYRQQTPDVQRSLFDLLDKYFKPSELEIDYQELVVEGELLTDADYIICKLDNNNIAPIDVVVWLGEDLDREDDSYSLDDEVVFNPLGAQVLRRLSEVDLIRTIYTQRGYDIDWAKYDEEHNIQLKWYMQEVPKIHIADIGLMPIEEDEEGLDSDDSEDDPEF